jgi:hypothetical protein
MPDSKTKMESVIATAKSKSKKRVRGNAVTRLAKATARNVRDKSEELSAALVNRALEGDVSCTKLLLTLIEKCPEKKRKFRSMAEELANAAQWQGDWPKARPNPEDFDDSDEYLSVQVPAPTQIG